MQKYQNNVVNTNGVPVSGVTVTVTTYPGGSNATIYSDNGVTPASNPLTTDSYGNFSFYAADGRYSVNVSGSGIANSSISDILLEDPANASPVVISGGLINNTPIGTTTPSTGAFTTLSTTSAATVGGGLAVTGALSATGGLNVSTGNTLALQSGTQTAGTGIAFPATQLASTDPNTLDDYREGTWTPSLGGTATYTTQVGTYTKIGRQVTAYFEILVNAIGTGSTTTISGLPFTNSVQFGTVSIGYWSSLASSVTSVIGTVNQSTTSMQIYASTAAAATVTIPAIFGNSARLIGTATYFV